MHTHSKGAETMMQRSYCWSNAVAGQQGQKQGRGTAKGEEYRAWQSCRSKAVVVAVEAEQEHHRAWSGQDWSSLAGTKICIGSYGRALTWLLPHPLARPIAEACYIRVGLNLTNCMCTLLHLLERMWRRSRHQAYIDVRNKTITAASQRRITIKWLIKSKKQYFTILDVL